MAMTAAAWAHTAVADDSANTGRCISRSIGSIGARSRNCRRRNTVPTATAPASFDQTSQRASLWPSPPSPVMNRASVAAFSAALSGSNRCCDRGEAGRNSTDSTSATSTESSIAETMVSANCR